MLPAGAGLSDLGRGDSPAISVLEDDSDDLGSLHDTKSRSNRGSPAPFT